MKEDAPLLTAADLHLQTILETSPVGMLVFNDREEIIAANPPAEKLFGLSPTDESPLKCGDFFRCINRLHTAKGCGHSGACSPCPLFHGLRATLAGTATIDEQQGEVLLNREPGCEPMWLRYTFRPLAVKGRQGVLLTVDNISDLRRSEHRYAQLFEEMLNAFALHEIICDDQDRPIDYRFITVNPAFERMTGLSAAMVVGRTVLEVLPDIDPHWIATYGQVALTGQPIHFENYFREIGKHFSVHAFRPAPRQFACLFEDITERKRAEETLRLNEARLRKLADILQHPAETARAFLDYALEQAIQLTGSRIGYIYHYDENRQQLFLNAWSREVLPACTVANPMTCYALKETGLWGEAIHDRA
jgi:PAS domain S-box-containing protein